MYKGKPCIAIMSIGSGVGQSVISSINLSTLDVFTLGLGNNPLAYGISDCDHSILIPSYYANDYIANLIDVCRTYKVDIIIPGSDDETLVLSENVKRFKEIGCQIIVSDHQFIEKIRNKAFLQEVFPNHKHLFARTFDLIEAKKNNTLKYNFPLIVKPKSGFASKDIKIVNDMETLLNISGDFVCQEIIYPSKEDPFFADFSKAISDQRILQVSELSIQVVLDQYGEILGKACTYNKLNNGVPIEIIPYTNEDLWKSMNPLINELSSHGVRGPINFQGRWTDNGLKLFEINARFTGITGLRALLGFNEVEVCIQDFLDIKQFKELSLTNHRIGIRQTTDRSIFINHETKQFEKYSSISRFKHKEVILLTGASGYLGQALIESFKCEKYRVIAAVRSIESIVQEEWSKKGIEIIKLEQVLNGNYSLSKIDTIIHCAFSRPHRGEVEIMDSLRMTQKLFEIATNFQVPKVINISTQSVYGNIESLTIDENDQCVPSSTYGIAKYSSELILNSLSQQHKNQKYVSLRLPTLMGKTANFVAVDIVSQLIQKVLKKEEIILNQPNRIIARLDVRDAADSIWKFLESNPKNWMSVYNVVNERSVTISDILSMINSLKRTGIDSIDSKKDELLTQIDSKDFRNIKSNRFNELTGWKSKITYKDSIYSYFM